MNRKQREKNRRNASTLYQIHQARNPAELPVCVCCGKPGRHFVPPCFGQPGFYACGYILEPKP